MTSSYAALASAGLDGHKLNRARRFTRRPRGALRGATDARWPERGYCWSKKILRRCRPEGHLVAAIPDGRHREMAFQEMFKRMRKSGLWIWFVIAVVSASAQSWDINPFVGGRFGGSLKLEEVGQPNFHARIEDNLSFGISGGFRFDQEDCTQCSLIEFRWMRELTHVSSKPDPLAPTPYTTTSFRAPLTMDHFLGDFTREWVLEGAHAVRPFVTGTLGAVRMEAPASSATRFAFGLGTGFKVFPSSRWGLKFQVEYLPIVLSAEVQRLACIGGCIVVLNGGIANQFTASVGPVFRF
jgi:hypothetical protein